MCGAALGAPVGRNRDSSDKSLATLNYLEIKQIMDRRSTQQKQGKLTDAEIKGLVKEWHDQRREGDLNKAVVDREMKTMEAKLEKYNVDQLGEIPIEREDGTMRIMVCQMGGCAGKEVREKNVNHGKTHSKVQRQPGGVYGTKLQLVQSELVSQLSIMAPPGRKGDKIHNSPQHTGTGCSLITTPTRRYDP